MRVAIGAVVLALLLSAYLGTVLAVVGTLALVHFLFLIAGTLQLETAFVAGRMRPLPALIAGVAVPAAVLAFDLFAVESLVSNLRPVVLLAVHVCAAGAGLEVLRFRLADPPAPPPSPAVGDPSNAELSWSAVGAWTFSTFADRAVDVLPFLLVLLLADPYLATAYAIACRLSAVVEVGSVSHVVARPAAAAYPPADPRFAATFSAAVWGTLVTSILLAGVVVASTPLVALAAGVDLDLLVSLVRLWVVLRLLAMAAGPAAELLETGGFIVLRVAVTAGAAGFVALAVLPLGPTAPVSLVVLLSAGTRAAAELLQALSAYRRTGLDCTVLALLRPPGPRS